MTLVRAGSVRSRLRADRPGVASLAMMRRRAAASRGGERSRPTACRPLPTRAARGLAGPGLELGQRGQDVGRVDQSVALASGGYPGRAIHDKRHVDAPLEVVALDAALAEIGTPAGSSHSSAMTGHWRAGAVKRAFG